MWSHAGIICTGETYKDKVKLTFAKGAALLDPSGVFNSSLDGNIRRAIDFHQGDKINEKALKALIRAAVALNTSARRPLPLSALRKEAKARLRRSAFAGYYATSKNPARWRTACCSRLMRMSISFRATSASVARVVTAAE